MKKNRWILRKDYDIETVEKLAESLGVDRIIATLLVERGVTTFDEAKVFFRPNLDQLHDPFLMKDMDKAIERINKAIQKKERILVYGDYDVDGTSAVALVYSFFRQIHTNIDFYIPDRDSEGSGVSMKGINYAHATGVSLIITLDCGVKAVEQTRYARTLGIDIIVGDHHLPGDELPPAVAILDPKLPECHYPFKELAGCGVGFKIIEAYLEQQAGVRLSDHYALHETTKRKKQESIKLKLLPYLDLVAISIASDIVPIVGENRVLATYGLRVINTCPRPGIEALLYYGHIERRTEADRLQSPDDKSYFSRSLTISDLVFLIGPRINAAGRMRSAFDSVRILISTDTQEARALAAEIDQYNLERKDLDQAITEDAQQRVKHSPEMQHRHSIVLADDHWHRGVVGIVASRLAEAYYKPTIIFTRSSTDDVYVGSARSYKDFDIHNALEQCADLLENYGGHKYAAGVTIKPQNYEAFVDRFETVVSQTIRPEDEEPELVIDAELSFHRDLTPKFLHILKLFAPYGPGNPKPLFLSRRLVDTGYPRIVGNNHLRFSAIQLDERSHSYPAIGLGLGNAFSLMKAGNPFSLCYTLDENHWYGKTTTQLNVKDIRFEE